MVNINHRTLFHDRALSQKLAQLWSSGVQIWVDGKSKANFSFCLGEQGLSFAKGNT